MSFQVVLGAAYWVEQCAFVLFEDIWLEVVGHNSPHRNPIDNSNEIHLVENGVEAKVNEKVV